MAYLTHKKIKGGTYYYAEESEWRDGKSRRKWQKYLGTVEKIITAVEGKREKPTYAEIFQLGLPAAYWHIAHTYEIEDFLDRHLPKRSQGLSNGSYLTLAGINRAIRPVSKRSLWDWFQDTVLLRVLPHVTKKSLSSQRFWDNMSMVEERALEKTWLKLIDSILKREEIDVSCVSFDGTNFYTFIGSFNLRSSLARRGRNKQKRSDLRQINYALFVTRKDHVPLFYDVYEGNRPDSKEFAAVIDTFCHAFATHKPDREGITIVFDKGNNSTDNLSTFAAHSGYHFVGSVRTDEHKDLSLMSNNDPRFVTLADHRLEQVKVYRTRKTIYEKELTVVVTFNNNLYTSQVKSINNELNTGLDKLGALSSMLDDRRAGRVKKGKTPTSDSIRRQVSTILKGQYMKRLIDTSVSEHQGVPLLTYHINARAQAELNDTYLGKNILITDNHDWSTEDIILAYRSQSVIEDTFKHMKDRTIGTWWPMYLWTDHMIRVHGFYCSLALLLRSLMMKKVREAGILLSMNKLHEELDGIREVINVFKKKGKSQPTESVVSKLGEVGKRLFDLFEMRKFLSS